MLVLSILIQLILLSTVIFSSIATNLGSISFRDYMLLYQLIDVDLTGLQQTQKCIIQIDVMPILFQPLAFVPHFSLDHSHCHTTLEHLAQLLDMKFLMDLRSKVFI